MSTKIGKLITYFETGMEGSYWAFAEEGTKDFSGLTFLKGPRKLSVRSRKSKEVIFSGVVNFLNLGEAMRLPLLSPYVKTVTYPTGVSRTQLCICGVWFHHIPVGADLVLLWELASDKEYQDDFEVVLHE